jgi:protein phosphatase methylesterase 1
MIMHHGAGYSALSFACLAKELDGLIGKDVGVLAFDARRHGKYALLPRSFELNFCAP